MANTFSQIYVHIIFSTKGRNKLILASFRDELFKYIAGIIKRKGQTPLAVNGTADHVHIFTGMKPEKAISDLVRDVKHFSTLFVNERKLSPVKFSWQEGYAVFTYSHSQVNTVIKYLINQEEHHKVKSFQDEYREFMERFNVNYDEKYLFD